MKTRMSGTGNRTVATFVAVLGIALSAGPILARPLYFNNFTNLYGLVEGDDLYACGVCHFRWEGTGARNPYGFAIEQQLYIGQPILSAVMAVEGDDTDLDGFTNLAEITTHGTLPGYSCDNFADADNPPANFQSLITPFVPSCLAPMDLLITPGSPAFLTEVGGQDVEALDLGNDGTDFPITVSTIQFLAGSDPALSWSGPTPPVVIPVGASATLAVSFAPATSVAVVTTLRVTSDDPDQPTMDIGMTGLGIVLPRAPADQRAACLRVADKRARVYAKRSPWSGSAATSTRWAAAPVTAVVAISSYSRVRTNCDRKWAAAKTSSARAPG